MIRLGVNRSVIQIISFKAGWNGEGYVTIKVGGLVELKRLAVTFDAAVVNSCYELSAGGVKTTYDPSWSNILDVGGSASEMDPETTVDLGVNHAKEIISRNDQILDILTIFTCSNEQRATLLKLIEEIELLDSQAQESFDYSDVQKAELHSGVEENKDLVSTLLSCCVSSSNLRLRAADVECSSPESIQAAILENSKHLSEYPDAVFKPYIIARSKNRSPYDRDGTTIHHDMQSGDMTFTDIWRLNDGVWNLRNWTQEQLVKEWKKVNKYATREESRMEAVANSMVDRVMTNTDIHNRFSFPEINFKASVHSSTQNLMNRIKKSLIFELKKDESFVHKAWIQVINATL
jgi:hypothetical protein